MLAITLAFITTGNNSPSTCLYSGPDAAKALEIAASNPPGFQRCEVYCNPIPRKRVFGIPEAALAAPETPAPTEPEAPAPTEPEAPAPTEPETPADLPAASKPAKPAKSDKSERLV